MCIYLEVAIEKLSFLNYLVIIAVAASCVLRLFSLETFYSLLYIVLTLYEALFVLILLGAEINIKLVKENLGLLNSKLGKGLFQIFIGLIYLDSDNVF